MTDANELKLKLERVAEQSMQATADPNLVAFSDTPAPIRHLVLDAGAFISGAKLDVFGPGVSYWTIADVINEIKDKRTRALLAAFPFKLQQREVSSAAVRAVSDFARTTGDLHALSVCDLKVLALAYMFERENHGTANLHTVPPPLPDLPHTPQAPQQQRARAPVRQAPVSVTPFAEGRAVRPFDVNRILFGEPQEEGETTPLVEPTTSQVGVGVAESAAKEAAEEKKASSAHVATSTVACITTDYTMQNIMAQLGLRLLSVDGKEIRSVKHFVLRCHACNNVVRDMRRQFCALCGGSTLVRMEEVVHPDGRITYHGGLKKIFNLRGTRFPLPQPKGGRNANDLILREDQYAWIMPRRTVRKEKPRSDFESSLEFGLTPVGANEGIYRHQRKGKHVVGYGSNNPNAKKHFGTGKKKKRNRRRK